MPIVTVTRTTGRRIATHRVLDNGMIVRAHTEASFRMRLNQGLLWLRKDLFSSSGDLFSIPAAAGGTRNRWRCAFRTGEGTRALQVSFIAALARGVSGDPFVRCSFTGGLANADFHYGADPLSSAGDQPSEWGYMTRVVACSSDTEYQALFEDRDNGRLIAGSITELALDADTANGFLAAGVAPTSPIFHAHRRDAARLADDLWRHNAAHVFNWSTDTDGEVRSRTSTTDINVIDNSSTTITGATPGYKLDLSYRNRRSKTTVPCVVWVYGGCAGAGTGHVYVKDSAGTVKATVNLTGAAQWRSTTFNADPAYGKLDFHYDSDGTNATTVYALSCYQYEP